MSTLTMTKVKFVSGKVKNNWPRLEKNAELDWSEVKGINEALRQRKTGTHEGPTAIKTDYMDIR